jgi:hypothetical protein
MPRPAGLVDPQVQEDDDDVAPVPPPDDDLDIDMTDPDVRAWFEKHRAILRDEAYGPRLLYSVLALSFAVGLVLYVAGYALKSGGMTEPFALIADVLYTFGFALWTAAVVVLLVEVIPEVKRRQIRRALEAYEATQRRPLKGD